MEPTTKARRSVGPMVWFHLSLTEGFDGRTIRTVGPTRVLVVPVPRPEPVAVVGKYRLVGEVINKFMHAVALAARRADGARNGGRHGCRVDLGLEYIKAFLALNKSLFTCLTH